MKRNTLKVIEKFRASGKISDRYDMTAADATKIRQSSKDDYELITRSFEFGYAQGHKAAMAEMKKKAKEAKAV